MRRSFSDDGPLRVSTGGPAGNRDLLRAWMGYYRAQPSLDPSIRPSSEVFTSVARHLQTNRAHFNMAPAEHYELVVWYWRWFVPSILRRHGLTLAPPSVKPLWGLVGYFRNWRARPAVVALVASVGIEAACERPNEEEIRWEIPADWRL